MKGLFAELEARLRAAGTAERAAGAKAYMKSELRFIGTPIPQVREAARDFLSEHRTLPKDELLALVRALWASEVHELRSLAIALLERGSKRLNARDFPLVKELLRGADGWAHVDWLAARLAGELVTRYPTLARRLDRWARDESFWMRRAALLALLDELRAGRGDFGHFTRLARPMFADREFFIRKALGWVLRDASRRRPQLTFDFVREHRAALSGLTFREASRNLPATMKRKLGVHA
ncbi:MAG: DNA alkylation repair protein [Myxococcaceae bacterium]